MRVLVIGATGKTGGLVVNELLERKHTVTALVRNTDSFQARDGLTLAKGSPLNQADVEAAFEAAGSQDPVKAVIVTLGAKKGSAPPRFMADSHQNLVTVMKQHQVSKIVTLAAFGTGDSNPNMNITLRMLFKYTPLAYGFVDHNIVDTEMKESGLSYVIARPCMLTEGPSKPIKEYGNQGQGVCLTDNISMTSVSEFLVDAAEQDKWDRQTPVISN